MGKWLKRRRLNSFNLFGILKDRCSEKNRKEKEGEEEEVDVGVSLLRFRSLTPSPSE